MAGAGYKLFNTGDVLTAAQVNTYLMQQTVMVFASATARNTALSGILAEGLVCYLTDTNDFQIYDGAAWQSYGSGDITGVTATSPLTGGGTSGSVTVGIQDASTTQKGAVQLTDSTSSTSTTTAATPNSVKTAYDLADGAIAKSLVDAKGDVITATADNTPARLAVGSNDTRLIAASGETTGLKWVADTQNTVIDAKGDLLVGSAADTVAKLSVGTNGQVLTADSTATNGVKWATAATSSSGLTLVLTQTIGSGVTSIAVTSAFSATYANYLITVTGGVASGACNLALQLGSTTTGYYQFGIYGGAGGSTVYGDNTNNGANFYYPFTADTSMISGECFVQAPQLAKPTFVYYRSARSGTGSVSWYNGNENSTTQHTGFTLIVDGGKNVTGGEIRVYGFANS